VISPVLSNYRNRVYRTFPGSEYMYTITSNSEFPHETHSIPPFLTPGNRLLSNYRSRVGRLSVGGYTYDNADQHETRHIPGSAEAGSITSVLRASSKAPLYHDERSVMRYVICASVIHLPDPSGSANRRLKRVTILDSHKQEDRLRRFTHSPRLSPLCHERSAMR
jgi:hypothetical protein